MSKRRYDKARKHSTDVRKEKATERNGTGKKERLQEGQEKRNCISN